MTVDKPSVVLDILREDSAMRVYQYRHAIIRHLAQPEHPHAFCPHCGKAFGAQLLPEGLKASKSPA